MLRLSWPARVVLGLAAAVLVADISVVAARSGSSPRRSDASGSDRTVPSASASPAPAASPTPARERGLPSHFAAPSWPRMSDSLVDAGPIDLAKAVELDGDGAESELFLTGIGFRGAWMRSWARLTQQVVIVTMLYEFADADGAALFAEGGYVARSAEGRPGPADPARGTRTVLLPPDEDKDVMRVAIVVRGPRVAIVTLVTKDPAPAQAVAEWTKTTVAQYAAL